MPCKIPTDVGWKPSGYVFLVGPHGVLYCNCGSDVPERKGRTGLLAGRTTKHTHVATITTQTRRDVRRGSDMRCGIEERERWILVKTCSC